MTEDHIGTHYSPAYRRASNLLAAIDWQERQLERLLNFCDLVKTHTLDRPGVFQAFLATSLDHQERDIDVSITRPMLEALFVDDPELLSLWREYLSKSSHHQHSNVDATANSSTSHRPKDGYDFLNKVRTAFREAEKYVALDRFLETLKSWRAGTIDTFEMRTSCFILLHPFPDLSQELNGWLLPEVQADPSASTSIKEESIEEPITSSASSM